VLTRRIAIALLVAAAAAALWWLRAVWPPFILAFLLAYLLEPPVSLMARRLGTSRSVSILVVYAVVLVSVAAAIFAFFPRVLAELEVLARILPRQLQNMARVAERMQERFYSFPWPRNLQMVVLDTSTRVEEFLQAEAQRVVDGALLLASHALSLVLAPLLAFYFLKDGEAFGSSCHRLLSPQGREIVSQLSGRLNRVLAGFIRGEMSLAILVGLMTGAALAALRVPFAALAAVVAGVGELIPYFGPFVGAVPALAAASLVSPATVIKTALALVLIQQVEGSLLAPLVLSDSMGLHPVSIILALLVGARVGGVVGLILAVPAAALLKTTAQFIVERWGLLQTESGEPGRNQGLSPHRGEEIDMPPVED